MYLYPGSIRVASSAIVKDRPAPSTRNSNTAQGCRRVPSHRSHQRQRVESLAARGAHRAEVAVEGIGPGPVVDDDEVAVALELVGKRDGSLVDVPDGLSSGASISMPFLTIAVPKRLVGWRPNGRRILPGRPGQVP